MITIAIYDKYTGKIKQFASGTYEAVLLCMDVATDDFIETTHTLGTHVIDGVVVDLSNKQNNQISDIHHTDRTYRNKKLQQSDWTQLPDSPLTESTKQEWAIYRQALRDLDFTKDPIEWPTEPAK